MMDKDAGAFPSEYMAEYQWFEKPPPVRMNRPFDIAEDPLRKEKFLVTEEEGKGVGAEAEAEAEAVIRALYRKRMKTIYEVDYCTEQSPLEADFDPLKRDALLASMIKILEPYQGKLMPPVESSRVVLGYCPMRRYLTGRTVYQDDYSKPAYQVLKRDFDRGVIRLAPKTKKAEVINYAVPPCRVGKKDPEPTWIHLKTKAECLDKKPRRPRIEPNPKCLTDADKT